MNWLEIYHVMMMKELYDISVLFLRFLRDLEKWSWLGKIGENEGKLGKKAELISAIIHYYDDISFVHGDVNYNSNEFSLARNNRDCYRFNNFGKTLADFCKSRDMHIINGRLFDDTCGNYTCLSNDGKSVVDYFIICI